MWCHLPAEAKKNVIQANLFTKQKNKKQTYGYQTGQQRGRRIDTLGP